MKGEIERGIERETERGIKREIELKKEIDLGNEGKEAEKRIERETENVLMKEEIEKGIKREIELKKEIAPGNKGIYRIILNHQCLFNYYDVSKKCKNLIIDLMDVPRIC